MTFYKKLSLYLSLFGTLGSKIGSCSNEESNDDTPLFSITRYQCSTNAIMDRDPNRQYRLGHLWLEEECSPSLYPGQCMMAVRSMSPYFEGAWLHDDTQIWDPITEFGDIFYPGGPGYGCPLPPQWNINGKYYLDDEDGRQRDDFEMTVDILCTEFNTDSVTTDSSDDDNSSDDSTMPVYRTNCVSAGTIDVSETDPYTPFTFLESDCDNGLPSGDCIGFNKLSSNCGGDCDRTFLGPNDVTEFNNGPGLLITNLEITGLGVCPAGYYGFKTDYLCGDFDKLDLQHTTCSLKSNSGDKYVSYGDETVFADGVASTRAWYQWDKDDCSNGLPKGECIAILKGTTYCCNYSFNFKSIQDKETVAGVEGAGITFEVSTIDECETFLNDEYDGSFWLSVDYLCGIDIGQTISDQDN